MERLDAWWAAQREEVTGALSSFALEVVTPGAIVVRWCARWWRGVAGGGSRCSAAGSSVCVSKTVRASGRRGRRAAQRPAPTAHCTQVGRGGDAAARSVLVSDKEAAELEELLALFRLGLGEGDQFAAALQVRCVLVVSGCVRAAWRPAQRDRRSRLDTLPATPTAAVADDARTARHHGHQEEAAALEAANVYAMLGAGHLVDGVMSDLRRTQNILDDLDESLKVCWRVLL
jgi:hypothetical protein